MKDTLLINLLDINESGKDFDFKQGSDQALDSQISSVIDDLKGYSVHLKLARAGDIYTAGGNFSIQKDDQCSLCGEDLIQNIATKFMEYIVIQDSKQEGHAPHSGLNYENTQETYFIETHELDVFEFLRELMAGNVPMYPKCEDKVTCEKTRAQLQEKLNDKANRGFSAFSALEKLKKKQ